MVRFRTTPVPVHRILRLSTTSRPESLTEARLQIRHALEQTRLSPKGREEMEIAVGELLSNVHRHAYPSTTGPVFVEVFHTYRTVTVIIIDKGRVTAAPRIPATLPDQNGVTGRGLYLVQRLADELQLAVNHRGHGLCVRATKWFKPPRHGAARWRGHVTAHVKHSRRRRSA